MEKKDLRIVFMGTPEFAVETLKALVENGYNVVAVVTQPDKPVGRHQNEVQPSEVKKYALEHQLPVLQPEKMKDPVFVEQLRSYKANLQVVVAFRMLPEVGVTTFFLDKDIDTGRVILQKPFDIPDTADVEYVYNGLMHLGADICLETLEKIIEADGHPESIPQEDLMGNVRRLYDAPKLFKEVCEINWDRPCKRIYDFIRGLSPYPGAWTTLMGPDGKSVDLKIFKTTKTEKNPGMRPGMIVVYKGVLYITTSDFLLQIDELQLAGKTRMKARDFLNGNKNIENYIIK